MQDRILTEMWVTFLTLRFLRPLIEDFSQELESMCSKWGIIKNGVSNIHWNANAIKPDYNHKNIYLLMSRRYSGMNGLIITTLFYCS